MLFRISKNSLFTVALVFVAFAIAHGQVNRSEPVYTEIKC